MLASRRVARLRARRQEASEARAATASRAAAYIRVSTEEQAATGHGLDAQERAVRAFAESQGYELVEVVADPGVSGATAPASRPGFSRLIELASSGAYSVLLVWKFDRLARQIVYAVTAVQELAERHGVVIRSVTEPIDTATPMGRTIFAVLAGMAEQERQAITERTWSGRREKAERGGFAGGMAPLGYERDRDGGLIPSAEADTVRRIFAMRAERATLQVIADRLNADGIPTKRGGTWRPSQVGYILDNPKYRGAVEYLFRMGGADAHVLREGTHAPIIR
ncbi:recombinase family protein [Rhodoplanes serenus]|uniref:Recombinase family protein n=1 Tax=Rhodoplanes serenus TaxID=200615 RepID=A0A9X4XS18_9BRAD|nr:recombinase family protein [Rhodoplanes serenus]MTW19386.1 recombinase family protein [Rhodoplanes serenus]